ncbi:hypothetical protein G7046_g7490 [Stylonectria norvegica]|nr:hypothetical protein G7046_g7490 [Stylonectria norvegica]
MALTAHELVPSNNHASPSGALPFLLPSAPGASRTARPVTGEKIYTYAKEHATLPLSEALSPRLEAYQALLTQNIRPAWLYALYLDPSNAALLTTLYLPSNPLLRHPLHHTLRAAATAEILKTTRRGTITPAQLYIDATSALRALSALLGDDEWFLGAEGPSRFDAEVFAYTYLMMRDGLAWGGDELEKCLDGLENLVRHRGRLYERCWGEVV